ncbi:MAG: HAD hydrolase-like protein [Candidatus Paceibacterota bacterium]
MFGRNNSNSKTRKLRLKMYHSYNLLFIFDLDGVLMDSREIHYEALNKALKEIDEKYIISKDEHLAIYDGLPTKRKLEMLTENKTLPQSSWDQVRELKQKYTQKLLLKIQKDDKLIEICKYLKSENFKIAICSNAVTQTIQTAIDRLGIKKYIDAIQSNELVIRPKPYPEQIWNAMMLTNAVPSTTLIVEDSHIGREGALESGATLIPVENPQDLTFEKIQKAVDSFKNKKHHKISWRDSNLNVLIPMAGLGSRFSQAGYTFPKPLIDVNGKPMIQVVVENLNIEANYIYIVQKKDYEKYNMKQLLNMLTSNCKIVVIDGLTEGAAVTTLKAKEYINNNNHLLIANSDQFIEWNSNEIMYAFAADQIDAGILTFKSLHPKWSYAKLDNNGFVSEVAEKNPISDNATVGIYYWSKGSEYVRYAEQMISKNIRTNNEFYVAPVFNEAIADGKRVRIKEVKSMHGLGVPEDLQAFLNRSK